MPDISMDGAGPPAPVTPKSPPNDPRPETHLKASLPAAAEDSFQLRSFPSSQHHSSQTQLGQELKEHVARPHCMSRCIFEMVLTKTYIHMCCTYIMHRQFVSHTEWICILSGGDICARIERVILQPSRELQTAGCIASRPCSIGHSLFKGLRLIASPLSNISISVTLCQPPSM